MDEFFDGDKPPKRIKNAWNEPSAVIAIAVAAIIVTVTVIYNLSSALSNQSPLINTAQGPQMVLAAVGGSGSLTQNELKYLIFMREEEKLARDLYLEMYGLWRLSVFKSIAEEEQDHMDAMLNLLRIYQIPDPIQADRPGQYVNASLLNLYYSLSQQGKVSARDALKACALQEEINMTDLNKANAASFQPMIKDTYSELHKDSTNHLRSFAHALEIFGIRYQGVYLPQQTIDTIVGGAMERGFMRRSN